MAACTILNASLATRTAGVLLLAASLTTASCGQNAPTTPATKPVETKPADSKPPETKPADTKPAETKPAETKPAETKPAAPAIDEAAWPAPANPLGSLETMDVKLADRTFSLEKAITNDSRFGGLSGRREIAATGGMIFIFSQPVLMQFVMRDCPIPIDIIYVDSGGRVTAMYNMQPEAPRTQAEKDISAITRVNKAYEDRLKKYSSRFDALIAIELKGGTLNINNSNPGGIELKVGQKLDLDMQALRKLAK
jgi:uncharacterized membrane protein (UPF0127 family)